MVCKMFWQCTSKNKWVTEFQSLCGEGSQPAKVVGKHLWNVFLNNIKVQFRLSSLLSTGGQKPVYMYFLDSS